MTAIGYARVSTDKQADNGVSLEDQDTRIRARATADALELTEVIVDDGYSASSLDRPGIQRLLDMVRGRQVQVVVVTKLDRLTRSVRDFSDLVETFNKYDVSLVSMGESLDTSNAVGRLIVNILVSVLAWERESAGERTAAALRHKKSLGEKTGGRVPYGYDVVVDAEMGRKRLVVNAAEQRVVESIRSARADGASFERIARMLNEFGVTTKEGRAWRRQYVQRVLDGVVKNDNTRERK